MNAIELLDEFRILSARVAEMSEQMKRVESQNKSLIIMSRELLKVEGQKRAHTSVVRTNAALMMKVVILRSELAKYKTLLDEQSTDKPNKGKK